MEPLAAAPADADPMAAILDAPAPGAPMSNMAVVKLKSEGEEGTWVGPALIGGSLALLVLIGVLYGVFGGSKEKAGEQPTVSSHRVTTTDQFNDKTINRDRNTSIFDARGNVVADDGGRGGGSGGGGTGGKVTDDHGASMAGTGKDDATQHQGALLATPSTQPDESAGELAMANSQDEAFEVPEDGLFVPELAGAGVYKSKNPGSGGVFGGRGKKGGGFGRSGMSAASQRAVADGLAWLAKVQEKDGHWDCRRWGGSKAYDTGMTGLALLAFLADGNTHLDRKKPYHLVIKKALEYLLSQQKEDGSFNHLTFYEQGIATIALCELLGMSEDKELIEPAQRATNFILSQMGPQGGFTYTGPGTDMSVSGFQIMAVKSAILAKLTVPEESIEKLKAFVELMTTPEGLGRYGPGDGGKPSMTAVTLYCRLFLGSGLDDPTVLKSAALLSRFGPNVADEYYTYYATYCMYQMGDDAWLKWNAVVRDSIVAMQETKDPALRGSWPIGGTQGREAGRIYYTAMNIMTLEVYYRYLPIYR